MSSPNQRVVDLEGCFNFRDLGGYPARRGSVRWRSVYRSDSLGALTADDVIRIRDQLRLGTVIDLRSTAEVRSEARDLLAEEPIERLHLPLYDGERSGVDAQQVAEATLADRYLLLAEFAAERIARVITTVAESSRPVVYHCAAGKDRTGVVSAVLLALLGVRDDIIVADYAATRENLDAIVERLMSTEGYQIMLEALPASTLHAEPETMLAFLAGLRARYGSVEAYARSAGVSDETLARLTDRLVES